MQLLETLEAIATEPNHGRPRAINWVTATLIPKTHPNTMVIARAPLITALVPIRPYHPRMDILISLVSSAYELSNDMDDGSGKCNIFRYSALWQNFPGRRILQAAKRIAVPQQLLTLESGGR